MKYPRMLNSGDYTTKQVDVADEDADDIKIEIDDEEEDQKVSD